MDNEDLWRSFTDLLSTILLFILLVMASISIIKQAEIKKGEAVIANSQKSIDVMKASVDKIVGIRQNIITDIKKSLQNSNLNIGVDERTGDITFFNSDILFELGSFQINDKFKENLKQFVPGYFKALLPYTQGKQQYISEIVVEGHTDDQCSDLLRRYEINLDLSQNRANSVVKYILGNEFTAIDNGMKEKLKGLISANGKSYSQLIFNADKSINRDKSRRVVFKFRLKDDELIRQINDILKKK
jgi:outer membrane protein OmpA-like peptidoglycan-associated protein